MKHPFFSIIVPVYKVEQYLDCCIQSIICQSFRDFELILVDDGSPDSSPLICDEWSAKDSRIKVIHKENGGAGDARNKGLDIALGVYVLFIDSDDYWCDNNLLQDIYSRSQRYNEDIILFGNKIIYENGTEEVTRSNYNFEVLNLHNKTASLDCLMDSNNFPGGPCIYAISRAVIEKCNLRFKLGVTAEDYEWIVACVMASTTIGAIGGVQYAYVKRPGSVTTQFKFSAILGIKNAFDYYYSANEKYMAVGRFLSRVYLIALMSFNLLPPSDRIKAKSFFNAYMKILRETGQDYYYWFVILFGFRLSSFVLRIVYKIVR